ncbi:MAG TPA: hypothetical protein VIW03_10980 [Anaeromyxobacter sp.]
MRFIAWNMALSAWLLVSAFALGHTPESAAVTGLLAVLIATFALASPGLPGLRFANSAFGLILGWSALLMPEVSFPARLSCAIVAALVFALSVVPGRSTARALPPPER